MTATVDNGKRGLSYRMTFAIFPLLAVLYALSESTATPRASQVAASPSRAPSVSSSPPSVTQSSAPSLPQLRVLTDAERRDLAPVINALIDDPDSVRKPEMTIPVEDAQKLTGLDLTASFVSADVSGGGNPPLPNWEDITSSITECDPKTRLKSTGGPVGPWPQIKALIDAGRIDSGLLTWINYCVQLCEKKSKVTEERIKGVSCDGMRAKVPPNTPENRKFNEDLVKEIDRRIRLFTDIVSVEEMYGAQCFFGPDEGHSQKIMQSQNGLKECMRVRGNVARIAGVVASSPSGDVTVTPVKVVNPYDSAPDIPWWVVCVNATKPALATGGKLIEGGKSCLLRGANGLMWLFPIELLPGELRNPAIDPNGPNRQPL